MERLTVPDKQIGEHTTRRTIIDGAAVRDCAMEIYWRLKAYEDTGLEPEICAEYKKIEDEIVASGKTFNRLLELLRAEKDGRLAVLPGADTSSVVPCRSCKYSYTIGPRRFCAYGVCGGSQVSDTFFCAYGQYKTNTGGEKE